MTVDAIRAHLGRLNVGDPDRVAQTLREYRRLIQRYGRRVNLVGRLEDAFIDEELILGCLELLAVAQPAGRLVDVGSGAGLPGVPLAVALPQLAVTLVEARKKRAAFLRRVKSLLSLDNVRVVDEKVETLCDERFDWVVSRAFKPPSEWLDVAAGLVEPAGHVAVFTTPDAWESVRLPDGFHLRATTGERREGARADRLIVVVCRG